MDPGVELALGAMYVQGKQFDKAITTLRAFLVSQPDYTEAMLLLAEAYEGAGRLADAVRQLEDVIREDPDQLRARAWLADLFERAGRWSEAATAWGDLVKLGPRARSYRARYATALVNAGAVDAGRRELVAITRETPRDLSACTSSRRSSSSPATPRLPRPRPGGLPRSIRKTRAPRSPSRARGRPEAIFAARRRRSKRVPPLGAKKVWHR